MADDAQAPITTIPPFTDTAKLPACAAACGPLYDANGACVPPALPTTSASVYTQCFCLDSRVADFSSGSTGVCDDACTTDGGLSSIASWFQSLCSVNNDDAANGDSGDQTTTTSTDAASSTSGSKSGSSSGNGGDWMSNHWQWVIFLVVMVVGIAGIWIGACIWRRRYLRRKDRQNTLGQKHSGSAKRPSWGPTVSGSGSGSVAPGAPYDTSAYEPNRQSQGVFMPGAGAASVPYNEEEKPKKKKWRVMGRT